MKQLLNILFSCTCSSVDLCHEETETLNFWSGDNILFITLSLEKEELGQTGCILKVLCLLFVEESLCM